MRSGCSGAVVEAAPVVRSGSSAVFAMAAARQWPDLPPDFSTSSIASIVTPFSTALIMSYTVSAATLTAVSASISTPVLSTVRTRASTVSSPRRRVVAKRHVDAGDPQRMAQRDEIGRALGGEDAGGAGDAEHVALRGVADADHAQGGGRHAEDGARDRLTDASRPLPETSTMRASPSGERWVRPRNDPRATAGRSTQTLPAVRRRRAEPAG